MIEIPITSNDDPAKPEPWATLTLLDASTSVTINAFKGVATTTVVGTHALTLKLGKETEVHVLAVTMGGALEFVPVSEQAVEYFTHLAWYDPVAAAWTVLRFQK